MKFEYITKVPYSWNLADCTIFLRCAALSKSYVHVVHCMYSSKRLSPLYVCFIPLINIASIQKQSIYYLLYTWLCQNVKDFIKFDQAAWLKVGLVYSKLYWNKLKVTILIARFVSWHSLVDHCMLLVQSIRLFSHDGKVRTVRAEIFAVVLFSRISRVKPSRKFPLQFMSIYSNDNISKIAKLTTRELPHLAKNRENNCTRK